MNRHALLPLAVFFIGGGFVLADTAPTPVARSFPWAGFLEENGFAVTGHRQIGIDLYTAAAQTTPCDTAVFDDVEVVAGRFHVVFEAVPEACLVGGQLFFDMAVGPVGGARTTLATASGNHTRLHAVPFASANDLDNRFTVGGGRLVFERDGGQSSVRTQASAVVVQPDSTLTNTQAVFAVRDANGADRLSVDSNNRVLVNERLDVVGASAFANTVSVVGELTVESDVTVEGDLTVGGAVSSTCPADMTFVAGWCIDNVRAQNGVQRTFGEAMTFCHSRGKMLCPYDALLACDQLNPTTSDCTTRTSQDGLSLWSASRSSEKDAERDSYRTNIMGYENAKIDVAGINEGHDYYCCSHAYTGAP